MDKLSEDIIDILKSYSNADNLKGMVRFGINPHNALGVSIPLIRSVKAELRKEYKENPEILHTLAHALWYSDIHEAKILAGFIDVPDLVTEKQMDAWVKDFDSWDVCDQVCGNLFDKTPYAFKKAVVWSQRPEEFVKRAGFVLMATLALHDKHAPDAEYLQFFPLLEKGASDERNFVKKAVNWALRQIGKRNKTLNKEVLIICEQIARQNSKSAKWITADALRELQNEKILANLHNKKVTLPIPKKLKKW